MVRKELSSRSLLASEQSADKSTNFESELCSTQIEATSKNGKHEHDNMDVDGKSSQGIVPPLPQLNRGATGPAQWVLSEVDDLESDFEDDSSSSFSSEQLRMADDHNLSSTIQKD